MVYIEVLVQPGLHSKVLSQIKVKKQKKIKVYNKEVGLG